MARLPSEAIATASGESPRLLSARHGYPHHDLSCGDSLSTGHDAAASRRDRSNHICMADETQMSGEDRFPQGQSPRQQRAFGHSGPHWQLPVASATEMPQPAAKRLQVALAGAGKWRCQLALAGACELPWRLLAIGARRAPGGGFEQGGPGGRSACHGARKCRLWHYDAGLGAALTPRGPRKGPLTLPQVAAPCSVLGSSRGCAHGRAGSRPPPART